LSFPYQRDYYFVQTVESFASAMDSWLFFHFFLERFVTILLLVVRTCALLTFHFPPFSCAVLLTAVGRLDTPFFLGLLFSLRTRLFCSFLGTSMREGSKICFTFIDPTLESFFSPSQVNLPLFCLVNPLMIPWHQLFSGHLLFPLELPFARVVLSIGSLVVLFFFPQSTLASYEFFFFLVFLGGPASEQGCSGCRAIFPVYTRPISKQTPLPLSL